MESIQCLDERVNSKMTRSTGSYRSSKSERVIDFSLKIYSEMCVVTKSIIIHRDDKERENMSFYNLELLTFFNVNFLFRFYHFKFLTSAELFRFLN